MRELGSLFSLCYDTVQSASHGFCCWFLSLDALQIRTVLLTIQALLSAPNPDDPLDTNVAELWKTNKTEAEKTARDWTQRYAMP